MKKNVTAVLSNKLLFIRFSVCVSCDFLIIFCVFFLFRRARDRKRAHMWGMWYLIVLIPDLCLLLYFTL